MRKGGINTEYKKNIKIKTKTTFALSVPPPILIMYEKKHHYLPMCMIPKATPTPIKIQKKTMYNAMHQGCRYIGTLSSSRSALSELATVTVPPEGSG